MSNKQKARGLHIIQKGNALATPNALSVVPPDMLAQAVDITDILWDDHGMTDGAAVMVMLPGYPPSMGCVIKIHPQGVKVRAHKKNPNDPDVEVPWDGKRPLIDVKVFRPFIYRAGHHEPSMANKTVEEVICRKVPWAMDVRRQAKEAGFPEEAAKRVASYAIITEIKAH